MIRMMEEHISSQFHRQNGQKNKDTTDRKANKKLGKEIQK
jgi:hypothetical protein